MFIFFMSIKYVNRKSSKEAVCESPASTSSTSGTIEMNIDNAAIMYQGKNRFSYVPDPEINDVKPQKAIARFVTLCCLT